MPSTKNAVTRIYEAAAQTGRLSRSDVATLVKAHLQAKFPGVKFSVTSRRGGSSLTVRYTDGPTCRSVRNEVRQFNFGGFDGMIDMSYSSDNWLMPDGTLTHASTRGTEGSRGYVPASENPAPAPGAVKVSSDCYTLSTFVSQETTPEYDMARAKLVSGYFGHSIDESKPLWNQYFGGADLQSWERTYADREENGTLKTYRNAV